MKATGCTHVGHTCGSQRAGLGLDLGVCAELVEMQLHS